MSLLFAERRLVGLEAAVERVELGVHAVGRRVDRRGLGVAVALDLLRLPVRVGEDHLALAVGVGADLLGLRPGPSERSSLATRRRSDSIRAYTGPVTSGGSSTRRSRTSTISTPIVLRVGVGLLPRRVS